MKWRVAGVVLAVVVGLVVFASPSSAQEATVQRVIDGDTIDVATDDGVERIRLLNIDTPETKDPKKGQECLGQEATTYTESILQPGDSVVLEFDREREDRYGRTLAHVKLADGTYASELIAAQGLGDAVVFGKNDRRFKQVKEALLSASENDRGFFDPATKCTLAAHNKAAAEQAAAVAELDTGVTAAEAAAALAALVVADKALGKIESAVSDTSWLGRRVFVTVGRVTEAAAISARALRWHRPSLTSRMSPRSARRPRPRRRKRRRPRRRRLRRPQPSEQPMRRPRVTPLRGRAQAAAAHRDPLGRPDQPIHTRGTPGRAATRLAARPGSPAEAPQSGECC